MSWFQYVPILNSLHLPTNTQGHKCWFHHCLPAHRRKSAKLEETENLKDEPDVKMDDEDDDEGGPKRLADAEEVQVRDIRYNLEKIVGNN